MRLLLRRHGSPPPRLASRIADARAVLAGSRIPRPARDFTEAERADPVIHGFMPAQQLLALLNERLACDLGLTPRPTA